MKFIIKIFFLFFLIFIILGSQPVKKDFEVFFSNSKDLPFNEKLLSMSKFFIGEKIANDPLGEGKGLDSDVLFSSKFFDCTTYVETVIAVSHAKSKDEIEPVLNNIRYNNSNPDYFERNHFMVTDWVPANIKKGYILPITHKLSEDPKSYKEGVRRLNKSTWFMQRIIELMDKKNKRKAEIMEVLKTVPEIPEQKERASYLLAKHFRENEKDMYGKLPEISIVMFIRNIPSSPTLVNHMGFIVKRDEKLFLRHAPQARPWVIEEILLEDYFTLMDRLRPPVEGVLFYKLK